MVLRCVGEVKGGGRKEERRGSRREDVGEEAAGRHLCCSPADALGPGSIEKEEKEGRKGQGPGVEEGRVLGRRIALARSA